MTTEEKSRLIIYLQEALATEKANAKEILEKLDLLTVMLKEQRDDNALLGERYTRLEEMLADAPQSNAALNEQLVLSRKNQYGSKSLKGTRRKKIENIIINF